MGKKSGLESKIVINCLSNKFVSDLWIISVIYVFLSYNLMDALISFIMYSSNSSFEFFNKVFLTVAVLSKKLYTKISNCFKFISVHNCDKIKYYQISV